MTPVVTVIPARYGSQRFPGKPLTMIAGKPLIIWVWERAMSIPEVNRVIVATDDERIVNTVTDLGGEAIMTPSDLASGSDRVGWVAKNIDCDILVNLQGDEPFIDTKAVGKAIRMLTESPALNVATIGFHLKTEKLWRNPNVVKVLTDDNANALYFSRQPIPYYRDSKFKELPNLFQHLGVYIYKRDFLLNFLNWKPSTLEKVEQLEQLRVLQRGFKMGVVPASFSSPGIDTPEDIRKVETLLKEEREN